MSEAVPSIRAAATISTSAHTTAAACEQGRHFALRGGRVTANIFSEKKVGAEATPTAVIYSVKSLLACRIN